MLSRHRGRGAPENRAEGTHATPIAQRILARSEGIVGYIGGDACPQFIDVVFERADVLGNRVEGNNLTRAQVHQLHARWQYASACQEERIKAHLVQGFVDVTRTRCLTGLIVDHAQTTVGGCVDSIDKSDEAHASLSRRANALLAGGRSDPLGLLNREVAVNDPADVGEPSLAIRIIDKKLSNRRCFRDNRLVSGCDPRAGGLGGALVRSKPKQLLKDSVHDRAQSLRACLWFAVTIQDMQAVLKRAAFVFLGARRRQCGLPRTRTGQGGDQVCHEYHANPRRPHLRPARGAKVRGGILYVMTIQRNNFETATDFGQSVRRGLLSEGDRVQVRDPKGRFHQVILVRGGRFQSNRGGFNHDDVIGRPDGQVIVTDEGRQFQILRPLQVDYVMSMPRGAAVVYPKDAGVITHMGDIFPGATVVEAGAGSGALSMALLDAVGQQGHLISVERRQDFADIATANVDLWFGHRHPAWDLRVGDVDAVLWSAKQGSVDRVVLDMLAPWENIEAITHALIPGGVLICYVATVTQMSRLVEDLRASERFTDPIAWEDMRREWYLDGLAVRPEHRMVAHTGFLVVTRLLAPGVTPQERSTRPAKAAEGQGGAWDDEADWSLEKVGQRVNSEKKVRKVRRDVVAQADTWASEGREAQTDE